jgi:hypothetical protein
MDWNVQVVNGTISGISEYYIIFPVSEGGCLMSYQYLDCIIWLLAAYGLLMLVLDAVEMIRRRIPEKYPYVRVVLLVRNAEEHIEQILRNAVKKDLLNRMLSDRNLVVIDMKSEDRTYQLLEKLQRDYSNTDVLTYEEREQIFDEPSIFSPPSK